MSHHSELFHFPFAYGGGADIGLVRKSNQDLFVCRPDLGFFVVVDGMGGLSGGEQAAWTAVSMLIERVEEEAAAASRLLPGDGGKLLQKIVQDVSDGMHRSLNRFKIRYGAALVCVWLIGGWALFANLGDCRGYLLPKDRNLRQITEDHNAAQELVKKRFLTRKEALDHPLSSRLVRFMGMRPPAQADCYAEAVTSGDRLLLCSDGLYGQAEEQQVSLIMRGNSSPRTVCDRLITAARDGGGRDNISVVCIHIRDRHKRIEDNGDQ